MSAPPATIVRRERAKEMSRAEATTKAQLEALRMELEERGTRQVAAALAEAQASKDLVSTVRSMRMLSVCLRA